MLSLKEVEELLPCPIKIEISCNLDDFRNAVQDSFNDLFIKHKRNYDTKIERIVRYFSQVD